MRAAKIHILLPVGVLFFALAFLPNSANAQSFGGGTSSSLYSNSSSSIFQSPGGTNQGGVSAQGSSASVLQSASVTVLAVTGAPAAQTVNEDSDTMTTSNEIIVLSVFAGLFALGVLWLLTRQIRNSY